MMKDTFEQLAQHLLAAGFFLEQSVEFLESKLIQLALERTGGNRSEASKLLGIHRNTLQRKMDSYRVDAVAPARKLPQKAKARVRRSLAS
ncbi:MAG: helix-turn-helix domain-containing protein [Bryobacteraceae bacterium]